MRCSRGLLCLSLLGVMAVVGWQHRRTIRAGAHQVHRLVQATRHDPQLPLRLLRATLVDVQRTVAERRLPVPSFHPFTAGRCPINQTQLDVPKDTPYQRKHVDKARALKDTQLVQSHADLGRLHAAGTFSSVTSERGFTVGTSHMRYSEPFLHTDAKRTLREMGHSFAAQLEGTPAAGSSFMITSMTRTSAQQQALPARGKSPLSAHSYGAAFDIAYLVAAKSQCQTAQTALETVLVQFHDTGRVRLVPEKDCIHVTVMPRSG